MMDTEYKHTISLVLALPEGVKFNIKMPIALSGQKLFLSSQAETVDEAITSLEKLAAKLNTAISDLRNMNQ